MTFGQRLRSTPVPPALLRWLPSSSQRFGPPRRRATLPEYFSRHAGSLVEVYPAAPLDPPKPVFVNAIDPAYFRDLRPSLPAAYVFSLRGARLLGSAGWVVGEDDTLLVEASFWREPDFPHPFRRHFILLRKRARPVRRLPGRTLSLASDFAIGGFGHFLHDSLPRLHLVEKAGYRLADFDWLYLPRIDTPTTRRLVAMLDFPAERILQHDPASDLAPDELVATSYPGTPGNFPAYTPRFLRERFGPRSPSPSRKLFLSREGFRRDLVNRSQLEHHLRDRGFEICRPHEIDAIPACGEAAVIVTQEGANHMNALFAAPGTRVLLLLSERCYTLPYAFTLSAAAGHSLWVQSCALIDPSPGGEDASPVVADEEVFVRTLDQMLAPG
jgi:capsular polysaccharide biosynthesis protein